MALKPINIRWIRTGFHTENQVSSRIMDNFLRIVNLNIIILRKACFVSPTLRTLLVNKTRINLMIYRFTIRIYNTIRLIAIKLFIDNDCQTSTWMAAGFLEKGEQDHETG